MASWAHLCLGGGESVPAPTWEVVSLQLIACAWSGSPPPPPPPPLPFVLLSTPHGAVGAGLNCPPWLQTFNRMKSHSIRMRLHSTEVSAPLLHVCSRLKKHRSEFSWPRFESCCCPLIPMRLWTWQSPSLGLSLL